MTLKGAFEAMDTHIFSKMQYDGLNYMLTYSEEAMEWKSPLNWLVRIPKDKILLLESQKESLVRAIEGILDPEEMEFYSEPIEEIRSGKDFITLDEYPSLRRKLMAHPSLSQENIVLYDKKSIAELMGQQIGNCNTFSIMAKEILEIGNHRWKLGISKIDMITNPENNHTNLRITTHDGKTLVYDPLEAILKK